MIPLLATQYITMHRFGPMSVDDDGFAVRPEPVETLIRASVQATPATRMEWLPDTLRGTASVGVISYAELRAANAADETPPDRIVLDGRTYEVYRSDKLPGLLGAPAHWEALAVEVQSHGGAP